MRITPTCRAIALHEIFDSNGVVAGEALLLTEIEQAWRSVGLRRVDLSQALDDARESGEFSVHEQADGLSVELTQTGQDPRDPQTLDEINEMIRAYATLTLLRRRRSRGASYGRRRADRLHS